MYNSNVTYGMAVKVTLLQLVILQSVLHMAVCEEQHQCPLWHFTLANATTPCSKCWPSNHMIHCDGKDTYVQAQFAITTSNTSTKFPVTIATSVFGLNRSRGMSSKHIVHRVLPSCLSQLNAFFCNDSNRQGYLCGECKEGCGIAIYTYYGLPCACDCHGYGIPLYLFLEVGFSTVFFVVVFALKMSANSSKWIGYILYSQIAAGILATNPLIFTILAKHGHYVPTIMHSMYGIWNMDFLRLIIPRFCVSPKIGTLGAISCGYIAAIWPLALILIISVLMELHKRNFRMVGYPWLIISRVFPRKIKQHFVETNLVHTFATFLLLSYLKIIYTSSSLLKITIPSRLYSGSDTLHKSRWHSADPHIGYFSPKHLPYAIPALIIFLLLGAILPLVLLLYPTRCVSRLCGGRIKGRYWSAVKTFIEAFQGSYKDGTNGSRDYRTLPALYLLMRWVFAISNLTYIGIPIVLLIAASIFMILAAFFGLARPYKTRRHNLVDVAIYSLVAIQCLYIYVIFYSLWIYQDSMVRTLTAMAFLPVTTLVCVSLLSLMVNIIQGLTCKRCGY